MESTQRRNKPASPAHGHKDAKTLLIVDDEPPIFKSIKRLLQNEDMHVLTAESGHEAMKIIESNPVAVVLSDQNMPSMDGISFLEQVRKYDDQIVRLLLTGYANIGSAIEAINRSHIFEYLTKPWDNDALVNTIRRAFSHHFLAKENIRLQKITHEQNLQLRQLNSSLEDRVCQRTEQLEEAVREGILMLSFAAEVRDENTGNHVKRIRHLTKATSVQIGLAETEAERIGFFSMMHDVGKIHVPDNILNKPGKLTDREWQIMKNHTIAGEKILGHSSFYAIARQIARSHHEWLDGNGYPDGLKGTDIPLPARIVAVADVFDALTHDRPYKKAWPTAQAIDQIIKLAGKQFDTQIVNAFVEVVSEGLCETME